MRFADRLKTLRTDRGLTHEDLAEKLNIDRTSIVHYENSVKGRIPRPERLREIAEFFNVSIDYLLNCTDEQEMTEDETEFVSDTERLNLEELQKKYQLTIDGKPASNDELEAALEIIRSLRSDE